MQAQEQSGGQVLLDHLLELRHRLFWVVLTLLVGSSVGYYLHQRITDFLLMPLEGGQPLVYTNPGGGFEFLIKIVLFFGFLVTIPVLIYNILKFIEPALFKQTFRYTVSLIFGSIVLLLGGAAFAFYVSMPAALHFLTQFSTEQVQQLLSTAEYLSFVMIYVAGFGLLFQIPLVMMFINKMIPLQPRKLTQHQRFVIVFSFIVAALLTPTADPLNQFLMAGPMIVLYQLGVVLVWFSNRKLVSPEEAEHHYLVDHSDDERADKGDDMEGNFLDDGLFGTHLDKREQRLASSAPTTTMPVATSGHSNGSVSGLTRREAAPAKRPIGASVAQHNNYLRISPHQPQRAEHTFHLQRSHQRAQYQLDLSQPEYQRGPAATNAGSPYVLDLNV